MPKWWLQTKVTMRGTIYWDKWILLMNTLVNFQQDQKSVHLFFDLFKLQLVWIFDWLENCSLFQWRRFWMYWEERCVCLCLEGLRWVTVPLGHNCRGNLEVFFYWGSWFYGNSQICILSSLWISSFFRTAESNFYSFREMTWLRSLDMANNPVWRDFDWERLEAQNFTKPKKC